MKAELNILEFNHNYKQVGFSDRLKNLMKRTQGKYTAIEASEKELLDMSVQIRAELTGLAEDSVLLRLRNKNSTIFQLIKEKEGGRTIGFNAQLPLTDEGLAAVLDGSFDPSDPALEHLASPHQKVTAIYAWLIYAPRSIVAVIGALAGYVDTFAAHGCSIFCRAANEAAFKAFMSCGYEPANRSYPNAPADLLVAHAEAVPAPQPAAKIEVRLARTMHDLAMVTAIRASTYMSEQECPFDEEFDGNDLCGAHLIGTINGEPAGCIRIRFFADFVKFERLAVRREFRSSKLSFRLVQAAMRYAAQKGYQQVYGHARHDLVRFWETFGFRKVAGAEKFSFSDVTYCEMAGPIAPVPDGVKLGDSPYRLIRPEGAWATPGPLERMNDPAKLARIERQSLRV